MTELQRCNTSTARDRYMYFNTLCSIVKMLENKKTYIDLRNECTVIGKIIDVDGSMNIQMENAYLCNPRKNCFYFQSFSINNRMIRYIHIPKEYSAINLIQSQLSCMQKPKNKPEKKQTLKKKRARDYNQSILQGLVESTSTEN